MTEDKKDQERLDRLAAYEDTGLEPCDYSAMRAAIDQSSEYKKQLSDVVNILGCSDIEHLKDIFQAEKDGRLVVLPCKIGDTLWSFYTYPASGICKIAVTAVSTLDGITVINTDNYGVIPEKNIGKTVFLTREEAEAALKKREEADNEAD